jgi:3alpha(or 20beta)-hydroxysteroid dehydrogenase
MRRLSGKVAIVTGAARGQGAAEAELFCAEGAIVYLTDVCADEGLAVAKRVGGGATFLEHDVSSEEAWQQVAAEVIAAHGRVDVLINNAGIAHAAPLLDTSAEEYMRVVAINQLSVFLGMKSVLAGMVERRAGSVVNVSSTGGIVASGGLAYGATKWAVRGMTKTAAREVAHAGVRVNSLHPGIIDTPMFQETARGGQANLAVSRVPLGRLGRSEEVASLALYLASDESAFCTGAEFIIDGGMTTG